MRLFISRLNLCVQQIGSKENALWDVNDSIVYIQFILLRSTNASLGVVLIVYTLSSHKAFSSQSIF